MSDTQHKSNPHESDSAKLPKSKQLYAKYKAQAAKEADEQHRRDTKGKIILGGTAIAAMDADPEFRRQFVLYLSKFVRDHERKYVASWLPPQAPTE